MGLNDFVKNLNFSVFTQSILSSIDNKLDLLTYANLYNYFYNANGQSYHTLVNSTEEGIREEFCLLVNDMDIILVSIVGYGLDFEVDDNLLTIYVYIKDYQEQPLKIPFIYDLNDTMTLYELNILLNQETVDLFFMESINDILTVEHMIDLVIPNDLKDDLRAYIDKYIDDKHLCPIVSFNYIKENDTTESDEVVDEEESNSELDFLKYNWVDVKDIAKKIFWNYSFEIAWAEDAWNLLMFGDVVKSDNTIPAKHTEYEYGDITLWLVAMCDIYFNYKVAADYEPYDEAYLSRYTNYFDDAERYIGAYLQDKIFQELNEQLMAGTANGCEFYNTEYKKFVFSEDSIPFKVYQREVEIRKDFFRGKVFQYFEDNYVAIAEFLEGTHWAENYFDMGIKTNRIYKKFDKILEKVKAGSIVKYQIGDAEFQYNDEDEVKRGMEEEIEALEQELGCFISDAQQVPVYSWIDNNMEL